MTKFTSQFFTGKTEQSYVGYVTDNGVPTFLAAIMSNDRRTILELFNITEEFYKPEHIIVRPDAWSHIYGLGLYGYDVSDQPVKLQEYLKLVPFDSRKERMVENEVVGLDLSSDGITFDLKRVPVDLRAVIDASASFDSNTGPENKRGEVYLLDLNLRMLKMYAEAYIYRLLSLRLDFNRLQADTSLHSSIKDILDTLSDGKCCGDGLVNLFRDTYERLQILRANINKNLTYEFDWTTEGIRQVLSQTLDYDWNFDEDTESNIHELASVKTDKDNFINIKACPGILSRVDADIRDYLTSRAESMLLVSEEEMKRSRYPLAVVMEKYIMLLKERKALINDAQTETLPKSAV